MCDRLPEPGSVGDALASLDRALDYLNTVDVAALPVDTQAAALKSLEAAEAKHTAARAAMLSAFSANGGPEADGHGAARVWLRWQTRVTRGAAAGAVAWMRRLAAHPVIERALAGGQISASWARELCAWTDRLPDDVREDADRVLGQAAVPTVLTWPTWPAWPKPSTSGPAARTTAMRTISATGTSIWASRSAGPAGPRAT